MKIIRTKEKNLLAESFAEPFDLDQEIVYRKLIAVEELLQFMKREGINRSELAERMGVGPSRITKMLSGDENLTIDTLVRAGRAVGADLAQTFVPQGNRVRWMHYNSERHGKTRVGIEPSAVKKISTAHSPQIGHQKPADHDAEDAA
jgi:plasmid maintenance system antidote protein VapI